MIATESTSSLQFNLERGERQLWAGVPRQGLWFRAADVFLIPFSLLWGGFAIFWEVTVVRSRAGLFFELWGIPFVAAGLYLIAGRFWADARRRARTRYAVTSDRIIITSGLFTSSVRSLDLRGLRDLALDERPDGSGNVWFGARPPWAFAQGSWPMPNAARLPMFEAIADARRVYNLIREAQAAANGTPPSRTR
jgi:hypothetical protein